MTGIALTSSGLEVRVPRLRPSKNKVIAARPGDVQKYAAVASAKKKPCQGCKDRKQQRLLGDRMGAAIGKATGRKPCKTCTKIEGGFNRFDLQIRKAARTVKRVLIHA